MYQFSEQNIFIFLLQVFLLLFFARILGELFRRFKQPALSAEILVGIILGPTILGRFLPKVHRFIFPADSIQENMLGTIMWLGLLFFLLETGLKIDFSAAWKHRGNALKIALTDIIVPMVLGFICTLYLTSKYPIHPQQPWLFAFFMATVMTISAMPITVRALTDLDLVKTDLGFLIMSALSVNEIIGWAIFTVTLGLFTQTNIDISNIIFSLGVVFIFVVFCLTKGRSLANYIIFKIKQNNLPEPGTSLTFICLLGLLCGAIFQKIGIHALMGFFIAGIMAGEAQELPEKTRQVISQMVYAIFVPLFFAGIGLKIDFIKNFNIGLILFVTVLGIFGKFIGAWIGTNLTRISKTNRFPVAIAHTPGGSTEIVMAIVALKYNFITEPIFVAIVSGAVISAILLGPWLKYSVMRRKEVSFLEFFSRQDIVANLAAIERKSAIHELCAIAANLPSTPNMDILHSTVLRREEMMGTAIEEGVALPHGRFNTMVKPVVIFARSATGIDWDSPDGKHTHFIFLILTPKDDSDVQMQILRIISKAILHEPNRSRIMKAKNASEIWDVFLEIFSPHNILR